MIRAALAVALVAGFALAAGTAALTSAPSRADTTVEQADSVYWAGDAARALSLLEEHLRARPDDYEGRWKAARAAVSVGLLENDREARKRAYTEGTTHGREAARLRPDGVDGLYWLSTNLGLRSFLLSPWSAAGAGQEVYDLSNRVLALDPAHAGAHHSLGKLALRVMQFSGFERWVARLVLGNEALRSATWELAERHLRRAVELDPTWNVAHYDLGLLYQSTDRLDLAAREFDRALELPLRHPGDRSYREDAEGSLGKLRAAGAR